MTLPTTSNFTFTRGDAQGFTCTVTFPPGSPSTNLADYMVWLQARMAPDGTVVFSKQKPASSSAGGGCTVDAISQNVIHILISGNDTASLSCPAPTYRAVLVYDVKIQLPASDPFTITSGHLTINADVTHP